MTRPNLFLVYDFDTGFYIPRLMTLVNSSCKFTEIGTTNERHFNILITVDIKIRPLHCVDRICIKAFWGKLTKC